MGGVRYLTSGESHGQGLIGIIEGLPAGLEISEEDIFEDLQRRQMGHGRGGRMKIETDRARFISGVRFGKTLGSPISLLIENADWKNWTTKMSVSEVDEAVKVVEIPRPGHADLAGIIKYRAGDIRDILERASARETATRVALGAMARKFLGKFGIKIVSHVTRIHTAESSFSVAMMRHDDKTDFTLEN
ncbi:MAG: chorismate synthase, partial [Chloroflexi bacterium]